MKVVIIGPAYPYRGGIADTNESLARAFLDLGHNAEIITFSLQYPNFLFPGKTQYSTDPKPERPVIHKWINTMNPLNWFATARVIRKYKPDLVIVRYWLPFMAMSLGTVARGIKKQTKVLALCDNIIPHEKRIGDKKLTRYFVKSCDGFIAMSKTVVSELGDFTKKEVLYLPHPINDNLGKKVEIQKARKHLGLDPKGKYVLFFGLIRKYKGLDLLIEAFGTEKLKGSDIKLIVAGEFYESQSEYDKLIQKLGIEDKITIINQYIPTYDIKYYFSAVDIVAQTYRTASQSGVSQIAYNFETPMLVTDVGGLSETVKHNEVGYVSSTSPKDIASWILEYFENNKKAKFVEAVKKEKAKYSWENFAMEVMNFAKIDKE